MNLQQIEIRRTPDYVLVERPENYEISLEAMPQMLAEISAFCDKEACHKVLIRGPATKVRMDPLAIFELGEEISRLNLRIAVAESHDATEVDTNFLENVVWNRGSSLKFFGSEKEALYWLRLA